MTRAVQATPRIVQAREEDIDRIVDVENRSWTTELRATRETLLMRLERGHIFLALDDGEQYLGMVRFSYAWFDPQRLDDLPPSFQAFSSLPRCEPYNAAMVYNLGVARDWRGNHLAHHLVFAMLDRAKADGCEHVVGDGRLASYRGSEQVRHNPAVKAAVDAHLAGGPFDPAALLEDPLLALYRRGAGFEPVCIKANYMPQDVASGGHRVMVHRNLTTWIRAKTDD